MMNSEKRVFATLGGIFMMCAGFLSLILNMVSMVRMLNYSSAPSFGSVIAVNINILFMLCGLFLLLRKPRVAAIMMCAGAGLYLLNVVLNTTINSAHYNWFSTVCIVFFYGLLGAALFGKGVYGLIMGLGAAFFRFIPFIRTLTNLPQTLGYGGYTAVNSIVSLLSSMLMIAATVMAGLYLFSLRKKA